MRIPWRNFRVRFAGKFQFHWKSIISSGAKRGVPVFKGNLLAVQGFEPAVSRAVELHFADVRARFACHRRPRSFASAPPTVPGTPMRPSIPPRLCLAQNVNGCGPDPRPHPQMRCSLRSPHRDRSSLIEGPTKGKSPSITRRFEPPPRNLCGMPWPSSKIQKIGNRIHGDGCSGDPWVPPMPR